MHFVINKLTNRVRCICVIFVAISNERTNEAIAEAAAAAACAQSSDRLCFHEKCGNLVKLTNMRRTAERRKPLDEFNNGVVMTARPVRDDEMFEVRITRLLCDEAS